MDYEIETWKYCKQDLDVITTHIANYCSDYEYVGYDDEETIIVHCKSEVEYDELDTLVRKF